jgi:succinate dehydrogenase / fumarate reductase, cytochrome b subunit
MTGSYLAITSGRASSANAEDIVLIISWRGAPRRFVYVYWDLDPRTRLCGRGVQNSETGFKTGESPLSPQLGKRMSATATVTPIHRAIRFYDSTNGKKVVMAATGVLLFGYVVAHLAGNLQVFAGGGPDAPINRYGAMLHAAGGLLWGARIVLLAAVGLHIVAAVQLWALNRAARPVPYHKKDDVPAAYAARTMKWSGVIVAAFVVFHVLHLTTGHVVPLATLPDGGLDIYANLVAGFGIWYISASYIVAVALLGLHLYHGLYSMFQSMGFNHPRYTPGIKRFAEAFAIAVTAGYIAIPVAVLAGILR